MLFSYNFLQSFFEKKLPSPKKLANLITMRAFEVEEVEEKENDFVLDIDVLPNRPDCYSHLGMAREIGAILGMKVKLPRVEIKEERNMRTKDFVKVKVKEGCNLYFGRVIFVPEILPTPSWMKKRLEACGINSINSIVDVTNYVMLEIGQPLHAFDLEKIEDREICVRLAKKGEEILTLDGERYFLDKNVLVISDKKKPVAIAGIKGGKESSVSEKTRVVFLESANFEKETIRRGSRYIDLMTESSRRFEHGVDPNLAEYGIDRAATLLQKICKAKIAKGKIKVSLLRKRAPKIILLDENLINSILGVKIPKREQKKILQRLQFEVKAKKGKMRVRVPTFRQDVNLAQDLVEEIGRIYGFEKIKPEFPKAILAPPKKNFDLFWENFFKDVLKELGFCEVQNYAFLSEKLAKICGFKREDLIEIKNPVSLEFQFLRPSLICYLLKNAKENLRLFDEIKIFEVGKIFKKEKRKTIEKKMMAALMTGEKFFEMKGAIDALLSKAGITDFWFDFYKPTPEETKRTLWHLKRSSEIKIGEEEIGFFGEISERVLLELEIPKKIVAFEIDFEKLSKLATEEIEYKPISPFPAILRDISIVVPFNTLVDEVLSQIERKSELIEDVDLIDIFEMEEGKKSLTFRIVFRAKDRALEPKEVDKIFNQICKEIERNPNWQIRK